MDLHAWITERVDAADSAAHAGLIGHRLAIVPDDGSRTVFGTITNVEREADGLHYTLAQHDAPTTNPMPFEQANAAVRRCEADRRILVRHDVDPDAATSDMFATACHGCGTFGYCDDPVTENLNDCPELLDLAHANGLTEQILTTLDRPQPPELKPHAKVAHMPSWARLIATQPITTADVPAALRGPHWKP